MLECGFCGGTLTRRSWHSGSQYNKVIWQCVTSTKKGKKFCPDSKGIAEETIEQAFVESYRLLCQNNKDVLDEFIARTEETLSENNAGKQLVKIEKDIRTLEAKRAKLVDMRLEEVLDKETYESKYLDLTGQIEQLQAQHRDLQEAAETENTMKKRIAEFRKTLEQNNVLEEFDRYIFESIVEKVIVGGYDEEGRKDPAKLIFIYKTGFQSHMDGANFKPPRKNSKSAKQAAGLCSHPTDKVETTCSHHSDDTCGDGSAAAERDHVAIPRFQLRFMCVETPQILKNLRRFLRGAAKGGMNPRRSTPRRGAVSAARLTAARSSVHGAAPGNSGGIYWGSSPARLFQVLQQGVHCA